ncbi:MAG: ArsR family transcriptional regulator [Candidatus Schekmanbacteria bacterium]|nr:MAG: ArsR family transcriptional regulator [Candidatus Schekmanbacteria bacterium]
MNKKSKALYNAKAKIVKALAHPTRLYITEKLAEREHCVCEFVDSINVDFSTISKHLSILKEAGIVDDEKRGKQVFYRLKVPCIINFVKCIEDVIKSNADYHMALIK